MFVIDKGMEKRFGGDLFQFGYFIGHVAEG